jgi:broad specificity phosphatase PhoE
MTGPRRILLVRHGETDGESSVRYHGSTDVPLSELGRRQMRDVARGLPIDHFDLIVASPLSRAWEAASLLAPGCAVALEAGFREIDFGRWEGLTREEIEATDPMLARDWLERTEGFEFPGGEGRQEFRARVREGLERILASGASSVLVVCHKGVIRTIIDALCGEPLEEGQPGLGECVQATRRADDTWHLGRRSSSGRLDAA